jgi:hypothetical protein
VRINEVASAAAEILPRSVPNRAMTFSRKPEIDIFGSLNIRTSQIVMNPCIQTGFPRAQNSVSDKTNEFVALDIYDLNVCIRRTRAPGPRVWLCPLVQLRGYETVSETFAMKAKVRARYADLLNR